LNNRAPEATDNYLPRVLCKVCAVAAIPTDTNLDQGVYSGVLTFGPNQLGGWLDETDVSAYTVWFADASYNKIGSAAVGTVSAGKIAYADCGCSNNRYSLTMSDVAIPSGATGFMVTPVDNFNYEMPVGQYVGGIVDLWTTTTTTTTSSTSTTSVTTTSTTISTTTTSTTQTLQQVASRAAGVALAWTTPAAFFLALAYVA
jgi:hypothetical protein